MAVIWDVTLCSPVYRYRRFGATCCLHLQILQEINPIYEYLKNKHVNTIKDELTNAITHTNIAEIWIYIVTF
jgi:hypothetical protein